jgi:RNA polymerase sigma-70 factor (ECF subfamily)
MIATMTSPTPSGDTEVGLNRWMADYVDGDREAFTALFNALAPRVYGYLLRATGNRAVAEDLVQSTFLKVHRSRERFLSGSPVVPWVFRIAQNVLKDEWRRDKRNAAQPTSDGELPPDAAGPENPTMALAAKRVEAALRALPEEQRTVVLLHKFEGMKMEDVAEVLGISSGAARVRAHRAYKAIAAYLERTT